METAEAKMKVSAQATIGNRVLHKSHIMLWEPLNLTELCPTDTYITACSSFGYIYLNLLVNLFGGSRDKERPHGGRSGEEYDFVVVGAGSAGCVVANRLTENPHWKVLLLEAGGKQPDVTLVPGLFPSLLGSSIDWQYQTVTNRKSCLAFPEQRCPWPRGKVMGGSSSINGLAYIRGNKADYDGWEALGNPGWSYQDVLPFFKKSERNTNIEALDPVHHGVNGEQFVSRYPYIDTPTMMLTEGFYEGGLTLLDFNGAEQEGIMASQAIAVNGERVSTNTAFIQPIINKRPNLVVRIKSEATKILIDDQKRAYGVVYISNGKKYTVYAKKEVIISAGSINSPKLLMLSGIGPRRHLEDLGIPVKQDLAVGENLHEHLTFNGIILALSNRTATVISNQDILDNVVDYARMKIKKGPLSSNGPLTPASFLRSEPDLVAPDVEYMSNYMYNWRQYIEDPIGYDRVAILPSPFYNAVVPRPMNLVPKSRGFILLNASDPHGHPILQPNYFEDESDFLPLLRGVRFLLSLENTVAFRERGAYFVRERLPACRNHEWGTDDYFICLAQAYTFTSYHPVGTCKMGPEWDKKAVVDNKLRVYGINNLRVIDASMMPVVVRGNTNAPSIMIGERGVDFVIRYWKSNQ